MGSDERVFELRFNGLHGQPEIVALTDGELKSPREVLRVVPASELQKANARIAELEQVSDMERLMVTEYQEAIRLYFGFAKSNKSISPHDAKMLFEQRKLLEKKDAEKCDQLKAELAEAEKVIEFYADKNNYAWHPQFGRVLVPGSDCEMLVLNEGDELKSATPGKRAREYLSKRGKNG